MRNLYRRLGISELSSPEEIRQAIAACSNASVREDAEEVLLVEARRRNYDRLHTLLSDIGALRANLGLTHGRNWRGGQATEYSQEPTSRRSKFEQLIEKTRSASNPDRHGPFLDSVKYSIARLLQVSAFAGAIIVSGWVIGAFMTDTGTKIDQSVSVKPRPQRPAAEVTAPVVPPRSQKDPQEVPRVVYAEPALALPPSGFTRRHNGVEGIAPLEIQTSGGSNYLVKLEEVSTHRNVLDVFIRGGDYVNVTVPLGGYRIKYAAGSTWYGYKHYFGQSTSYSQADKIFQFRRDGNRISGYTITLYQVANGNLNTSRIDATEF